MSAAPPQAPLPSWRRMKRSGKPTVFTIPATAHFIEALALGLKADASDDPLALARMTVLLPTRRACRALREAFLRLGEGAPVLLPRLMPLNDLDEDEAILTGFAAPAETADIPPAIEPMRRQLLLAALILKRDGVGHDQAVALAAELAKLIDQFQTEGLDFSQLQNLAPEEYAEHWQQTLQFLGIVTTHWPAILAEEGCIDPVMHRNLVFRAQGKAWAALAGKLPGPIIAAGSTGSIPATAELLEIIAKLPEGCVVLPGLDQTLDDAAWDDIEDTHPQYGLKHLLATFETGRDAVTPWPGCGDERHNARVRLVSEVMRPAASTERWADIKLDAGAVAHIERLDAPTPREEAAAVAMALREALETPGKTCALVTPDRDLALRVAAELERWDIEIDDSAGRDLDISPVGVFLRLAAETAETQAAPLPLLSLCKHPLAAAKLDPAQFRDLTRLAERELLRGPRPAPGLEGLRAAAASHPAHKRLERWIGALEKCCGEFMALMTQDAVPVATLLDAHMRCAELLATTPETAGPLRLWAGEDGEAAATFIAELMQACAVMPPVVPDAYPALFAALLKGRVVRPRFGRHPRLAILGPLEARLQRFDTVILGALNEGTWPADPAPDPWLSRPMRAKCGLPAPERRIGLAAHDIAEALCGPRVILSRSRKVDGAPTVPSRWLMRLDQVLAAAQLPPLNGASKWLSYAAQVTRPQTIASWPAPAPRPPVDARPRKLSVTRIEEWMRDPYAVYARHILRLRALRPLDADASAADYGNLIHEALQKFGSENVPLANEEAHLLKIGEELFARSSVSPAVRAFWWPRFQRIAGWFVVTETARRANIKKTHVEIQGATMLPSPGGDFILEAKADRIDVLKDGSAAIIDYKTGSIPKEDEVRFGYASQLPLEAVIVLKNGFEVIKSKKIAELSFWRLYGLKEGPTISKINAIDEAIARAQAGLTNLIATFDDPATPYEARPHPGYAPRYSDYEHLARVKEWASGEDGDE